MQWTLTHGMLYGIISGPYPLKEPKRRPAIASDDGVIIMWTATIPEPDITTLVYRDKDLEAVIYTKTEILDPSNKELFVTVYLGRNITRFRKIIGQLKDGIKEDYIPTDEEIHSIKIHLREALPLWRHNPPDAGFTTELYTVKKISI